MMQHFSKGALIEFLEKYDKYSNGRWDNLPTKIRNKNRAKTVRMFVELWLEKEAQKK
jgi:hypothetical protein